MVEPATLAGLIEPAAVEARPDWDGQAKLSHAISAKRQADALERIADALEGVIDHRYDTRAIRNRTD